MTYEQALEYIHSVQWRGSKRGLSRTQELLAALGSPEKKLRFVHVAGTNGKGSTSACLESCLRAAGYKTGLFTSPYITRFNERMKYCGKDIEDDELARLVETIQPFAEACEDKPTEFEIVTALGMMYFYEKKCDVVVLEVGLGGEFDSTNVIDTPDLAVITAIGLDHTQQLGNTITDVAKAKAGIIKEGGSVVIYGGVPEADAVFEETCRRKHATLVKTDFSGLTVHSTGLEGSVISFGGFENLTIPLAGSYQPYNVSVAITALKELRNRGYNISDEAIVEGLNTVYWPGRFELIRKKPTFVLDGAHNPHGIAAAVESIKANFGDNKVIFLTGVMADKDVENMIPALAPLAERFVTVTPDNPRSMPAEEYAERLRACGLVAESAETIPAGVRRAAELAGDKGAVIALGSLYFSQDIREAVNALDI